MIAIMSICWIVGPLGPTIGLIYTRAAPGCSHEPQYGCCWSCCSCCWIVYCTAIFVIKTYYYVIGT